MRWIFLSILITTLASAAALAPKRKAAASVAALRMPKHRIFRMPFDRRNATKIHCGKRARQHFPSPPVCFVTDRRAKDTPRPGRRAGAMRIANEK